MLDFTLLQVKPRWLRPKNAPLRKAENAPLLSWLKAVLATTATFDRRIKIVSLEKLHDAVAMSLENFNM